MQDILVSLNNGIGIITMNRPKSYNSMTVGMSLELQEQLKNWKSDPAIRVIVLTATGKAFCAGQDLKEATSPDALSLHESIEIKYNPLIKLIRSIKKPIVALVNGVAAGAGANIALACDIVIAKESASFIQIFSNIGLVPDSGGSYFLPRYIGYQKALALMMLGDKIGSAEAERMGMIYKYFSDDTFEEEAGKIIDRISTMPTTALALTKQLLQAGMHNNLDDQLELEKELQHAASQTEDCKEGINAFLEKRKPVFKGY